MYVVQVISKEGGLPGYLKSGRTIKRLEAARYYHHPSAARKARDSFLRGAGTLYTAFIFDPSNPDKQVPQ